MNDKITTDGLPELSDAALTRIERAVFDEIASERPRPARSSASAPVRRRRRGWVTAAGIAAAFVVGVLVTPPILGSLGGSSMSTAEGGFSGSAVDESAMGAPDRSAPGAVGDAVDSNAESSSIAQSDVGAADRDIIATASATVQVDDIAASATEIAELAESRGGYVESTEVGRSEVVDGTSDPAPTGSGYGWISIRVPSADLTSVIDALGETGEVLSSSTSQQDVTSTAIDLRARVEATRTSVQRLTELMSQSGSVSELIEAEVALTDRQAQLESYEQQLASLEDQVAMSSLQVQLTRTAPPTAADPAGFGDGLFAGWNGLVVSLNALVVAVGFLLPWLGIAALVLMVIWFVRRARRNRRSATRAPVGGAETD